MTTTLRVCVLVCLASVAVWAQPADRRALQAAVDRFDAVAIDGRRIATADLRGRTVLLDFWATWCAPCLAEIPTLREARRRHGDRLVLVGISVDVQERASFIAWLRRQDIDWPQIFDGRGWTGPVVHPFALERVPFNVLVAADGRVIGVDLRGERLLRTLDVLLNRD